MRIEAGARLSTTTIKAYLDCPRKYYYGSQPGIPRKTDLPRLCGSQIHHHIGQLYRPVKDNREFYFKGKKTALNAWFNRWQRNLAQAIEKNTLIDHDPDKADMFGKIGADCIAKYWDANTSKPHPTAVEKRFEYKIRPDVTLVGILDQIRTPSLEWMEKHRPELMETDALDPNYQQAVIIDIKSNFPTYDAKALKENPSTRDWVRQQYELHEDLQATVYSLLYERVLGKKPIGFVWYHLRSGMGFFTFRDERDYENLNNIIDHVIDNINADSYPKHIDYQCQRCDYMQFCREDRPFMIAFPEPILSGGERNKTVQTGVRVENLQGRMFLKTERRKKEQPPPVVVGTSDKLVIRNLPRRDTAGTEVSEPKPGNTPDDKTICWDCMGEMTWDESFKRFRCPVHG